MTSHKRAFVSFEPRNGEFDAFLSMEGLFASEGDPEFALRRAARQYQRSIQAMRDIVAEIRAFRTLRKLVPARKIWKLGNLIFQMTDELAKASLQLNDLYGHLVRDLGVKRKWLEKVIIFRRYLLTEDAIPQSLNWGRCEKGTRRVAERLAKGLPLG